MASYANSCIYTIRSPHTDKYYIGSTRSPLRKRLYEHTNSYKVWCKTTDIVAQRYLTSYEILKYGDAYIELLEEYPCENAQQLHKREGEHIRLHSNCVNIKMAGSYTAKIHPDKHETWLAIKIENKMKEDAVVTAEIREEVDRDLKDLDVQSHTFSH